MYIRSHVHASAIFVACDMHVQVSKKISKTLAATKFSGSSITPVSAKPGGVEVCVCVCVCACACACVCSWLSGPKGQEFNSQLDPAVVPLSKKLYSHCSSPPSCNGYLA